MWHLAGPRSQSQYECPTYLDAPHYDYAYDGEGNQFRKTERSSGAITTYTWNALHQMTSATLPDGTLVTYRYDALGRRVEQSTPAGTTRYVNLGANVVAEYDGANTLRASYLTTLGNGELPGTPLEATVGPARTYPLLDGVGSVTAFTDSTGAVSSAFSYTAYGVPVGASSGTYAYGTYGYDSATGLYYARARYYDPASGRFLGEDPLLRAEYHYGDSDPTNRSDPSGQMPMVERAWQTVVTFAERMVFDYVPGPPLPTKQSFPWGKGLGWKIAGFFVIATILIDAAMSGGAQKPAPPQPPEPLPPTPQPPAPRPPFPLGAP
jgi:RHS repeat-associated protein